ncbi:MAG: hypothetical protein E6H07_03095 [Bacteroidetes bacterium]|nr:MAG: hypothetical protein E6H07_03095 [Bacteroidota bacterium]
MIQIKYVLIFEVEFLHDYYSNKSCDDIKVIPSATCRTILQQHGLRFIASHGRFKVFAKVTEKNGKNFINSPLPENCALSFLLALNNSTFQTFTRLDLKANQKDRFYFNNLLNNKQGDTLHLAADTTEKKAGNKDLIQFVKGSFQFTANADVPEKSIKIEYTDTGAILQQVLNENENISRKQFSFDLSGMPTGRAALKNGAATEEKFYVANTADPQNVFGVVEIFYRQSLNAAYQFLEKDNVSDNFQVKGKKYTIHFANRQTTWRYNVVKKFNKNVTAIEIKKENGTLIEFETVPGGTESLFVIASKTQLPFTDKPVSGIQLVDAASNEPIISHLPNASLVILKEENGKLFSDIYITI